LGNCQGIFGPVIRVQPDDSAISDMSYQQAAPAAIMRRAANANQFLRNSLGSIYLNGRMPLASKGIGERQLRSTSQIYRYYGESIEDYLQSNK